ncbi:Cyclin-T1-3 [Apostasia shenzhenica]|uniref:Cyclin-T1-3 n=1 Tax=Apostasia shenzhenica TaxID=1088818 RepID=A0A2I0A5D5_9ASPA|nr:Cyclin-T1-3 [Apostasia shenzhenica]
MAGYALGDSSHQIFGKTGLQGGSQDEPHEFKGNWYFSKKEIEENSPSRRDGIDLKKESYLRKSFCTFLQDLGMRLKVPQVTIATAIVFCHRFFLRQSHAKNDRMTIATVCMFLAGKVEETPRPLKDVILVSYEIIHKKDPSAVQRIKQKEVYEQQKELILLGERLVLATLCFDLNVHHPYKPLVEAIKKFKVARNALAQVAWNFVNDGLRTSLCLQFKPHHIAAGAIFLAAKFLKVKLPSDAEKVWWQEFDVTPRQLEDVSNQMLELYEQNRTAQSSQGNDAVGSFGDGIYHPTVATSTISGSSASANPKPGGAQIASTFSTRTTIEDKRIGSMNHQQCYSNEHVSTDSKSGVVDRDGRDSSYHDTELASHCKEMNADGAVVDKAKSMEGITKIDKDKVKAALERTRKLRNNAVNKSSAVDDDNDHIERELENGIELVVNAEKVKNGQGWPRPLHQVELYPLQTSVKPKQHKFENGPVDNSNDDDYAEEGELSSLDEHDYPSPEIVTSNGKVFGAKRPDELGLQCYSERDAKRIRSKT